MPGKKNQLRIVARPHTPPSLPGTSAQHPTVSPRWLLKAFIIAMAGAVLCTWGTLCLLFWQGSWQLLYHPKAEVTRTPAGAGIAYDPVGFAATETGELRIAGWWIPAAPATPQTAPLSRFTILYLHGATGNLGDCVDSLARLHELGVNVLAFDYRGYGQSRFAHPSEARWREDANWALDYLAETRHIDPHSIVLAGRELGADLALEVAVAHPELAGVALELPVADPARAIFNDPRAHILPAHLLVKDRYDNDAAATRLRIPSLWLLRPNDAASEEVWAWGRAAGRSTMYRLREGDRAEEMISAELSEWLVDLRPPSGSSLKDAAPGQPR